MLNAPGLPATPPRLAQLPWSRLWQGHDRFSLLHTGGSPQALAELLQLWQHWQQRQQEPTPCPQTPPPSPPQPQLQPQLQLVLVCDSADQARAALQVAQTEDHGLQAESLARLRACWPPLTPNLHPLDLDPGRAQLLLCLGPLPQLLPRLRLQADVLWLQAAAAVSPPQRLRLLKALARLAAADALACGAAAEPGLLAELRTAGFQAEACAPAGQVWARHRPFARHAVAADRPVPARSASDARAAASHPDWLPPPPSGLRPGPSAGPPPRTALVIGAGLAGAAAAQALARQGLAVTVLDRHAQPASETSGNPAALFHGTVNPDDGPYARLFRAAALVAQREYAAACQTAPNPLGTRIEAATVAGDVNGLLRLQTVSAASQAAELAQMAQQLQRLGLPPDYVQAVDATQASRLAGCTLAAPAWFYPGGGWIDPGAWVRYALQTPGVRFQGQMRVHALQRQAHQWQALNAAGQVLAQADVVVLACALGSQKLLPDPALPLRWPLRQTRGQVTQLQAKLQAQSQAKLQAQLQAQLQAHTRSPVTGEAAARPVLNMAVAGDGYALPLPTAGMVLCGATRHAEALRDHEGPYPLHRHQPGLAASDTPDTDHAHNLRRLQGLTGLQPEPGSPLQGRVGWRLHTDDRLPMAGPLPDLSFLAGHGPSPGWPVRLEHARRWPRCPGLFVLTALGARGVTLAPLLGRLVAAQAAGAAWPLEQDLADAVDPVRWALRAARSHQADAPASGQVRAEP